MAWRVEDEALLQRLEDEVLVQRLLSFYAGPGVAIHRRAGGLVAELRRVKPEASRVVEAAALGGDVAPLAALVDGLVLRETAPALLHHLALFHGTAAEHLATHLPDRAARAWTRALSAWIALGEERTYLDAVEDAVLGPEARTDVRIPPGKLPLELVASLARHADRSARGLGTAGRGALLALASVDEAARLAGASEETRQLLRGAAQRHRNAAIEAALSVTGEALDEASVREGGQRDSLGLLLRTVAVWGWTSNDEAVEHFVVDRLDKLGWVLYRARSWIELRALLEPFRPMIDSLARRIAEDPAQIAYASGCAQMFVFLSEVERNIEQKIALAERAVAICPTHRNGRLVLAAFLCQSAQGTLGTMTLFARRDDLVRCEAMIARAEKLYPQSNDLPAAKALLEAVKKGRLAV